MIDYNEEQMPEEIKVSRRIVRFLSAVDFLIIVTTFLVAQLTQNFVAEQIRVIYQWGLPLIAFLLTRSNDKWNPKKKIYESMLFYFQRDTTTYESVMIDDPVLEEKEEGELL